MNKIIHYKSYDLKSMRKPNLIAVTHANDVDTQFIELHLLDGCNPVTLSASYTYTALMVNRDTQALIDDGVPCTLNESGNVEIPIDNLHTQGGMNLLIELTITDSDGNQVLVTPFPLTVHVNPSILDDAQVTPESQGTVPELLGEAKDALDAVKTVSATVNQNGTITFEFADSSAVTTTGASVIGKSAYQVAVDNGFIGTEQEWLASLKGDKGDTGATGAQGEQGVKGDPGATGADGFSPTAAVTQTQSGATVTITDKNGTTTANISNGAPGQDYVLTARDKDDIAAIVLSELPTTQGVQYGNSND